MRLFHLSDLHLGKNFRGYDLLEDQAYVLDRVVEALAERKPSLMIIAGDVYDRAIPPVGAIACFDSFLQSALKAVPGLKIVVIPGNHDSSGRLAFGSKFMAEAGIEIVTEIRREPIFVEDLDASQSGREEKRGVGRVAVWALPFLTQLSADWRRQPWAGEKELEEDDAPKAARKNSSGIVSEGEPRPETRPGEEGASERYGTGQARLLSQDEMMRKAVGAIRQFLGSDPKVDKVVDPRVTEAGGPRTGDSKALDSKTDWAAGPNILVAHCFAAGALVSESETAFVGAAEQVGAGIFEGFDYVALGHLHRCQSPAPKAWYSGSPMAYSMGEAGMEKGFLEVETGGTRAVRFVRIKPLRELRRLRGLFRDLVDNPLPKEERGDYVEATLLDEEPVANAGERLKELYPRLVGTSQECFRRKFGSLAGAAGRMGAAGGEGGGKEGAETAAATEESAGALAAAREALDPLSALERDFEMFHREMKGGGPEPGTAELFSALAKEALHEAQ